MQLKNMLQFKMNWARPDGRHSDVVLSSRIRLARNFDDKPFPVQADPAAARTVLERAFAATEKSKTFAEAARIRMDAIDPLDRYFLVERRLISNHLAAHPKLRGVVVGDKEILSLMVNEEDHLRLQAIDSGLCLDTLLDAITGLDDDLSREISPAFDPRLGYLTACPTNVGTGMRASGLVHLPALSLTGQMNGILSRLGRIGVTVRGIYGEGTKVMGDFYQLSNSTCLGLNEAQTVADMQNLLSELIKKEQTARRELCSGERKLRLQDLVYRSIGTLSHARSISFEETMQHLSYARMGLSLKWKDLKADLKTVNELLVLTQPMHIQMLAGKPLDACDRDFLRATLLRKKFK